MIVLYGIPNCDTVRKARRWLEARNVNYRFHDYRKEGIDTATLAGWAGEIGWENLLNRRGATWRTLAADVRDSIDERGALALMSKQPSLIKRPLLDTGDARHVGFSPVQYEQILG